MLIGYARVSTEDQSLNLQLDALRSAGCTQVFEDHGVSGTRTTRPGLDAALAALAGGDTLVVWRLDRLGRSLQHLIQVITSLGAQGIGLRSLTEAIDTESAGGRLVFHVFGAMAEFERALVGERTKAGLKAAKGRGVRLGRRPGLSPAQLAHARVLLANGESASVVARSFGVGRSTLYRSLAPQA